MIKLDGERKCKHVNFLGKSDMDEQEFLFSAYSAFKVESVEISPTPTRSATPHTITIIACADNKEISTDVPTAPWH